jgi:hypothetical protein
MVITKHLHHSRDTERQLIFDSSSDCCCTEGEAHDWIGRTRATIIIVGTTTACQEGCSGGVQAISVQLDDARVNYIYIYIHQADKKKGMHIELYCI